MTRPAFVTQNPLLGGVLRNEAGWVSSLSIILFLTFLFCGHLTADEIPATIQNTIANTCLDCHDAETEKGEVSLEVTQIDWTQASDRDLWLRVHEVIDEGSMPPPKKKPLAASERSVLLSYLDENLTTHTAFGGTLPRRLNKAEYEATIRALLYLPNFELPAGFPADNELHGFDNVAEGLVLSPPHLEAYAKVAASIADELFPPARPAPERREWHAGPADMALSFSAATVHSDALRLVSRSVDIMRSCTWPSRIEMRDSGTYRIAIAASKFLSEHGRPFEGPMILEVYARAVTATDRSKVRDFRLLKEIEVTHEYPDNSVFEADLFAGETVLFRWKNAEMTHDPPNVRKAFVAIAKQDPRFLAAWLKVVFPSGNPGKPIGLAPLRGRNGWESVLKHMADPNLDLTHANENSALAKAFFNAADKGKTNLADCLCYYYHERGPALEIHGLTITGPHKLVDSPADLKRRSHQAKIVGTPRAGQSQTEVVREILTRFLPRAFRRPVSDETIDSYLAMAQRHWEQGHSLDESMHLLLRNILISPRFLYRSLNPGVLDDFDLATRLSYFLTQRPPDATLLDLAQRNRLSITRRSKDDPTKIEYWVIRREAERLMPKSHTAPMIQRFVGQWLDTQSLHEIMPDPKFNFGERSIETAKYETEQFFTELLVKNLPMTDFIDPDFTFSSIAFVKRNYGFTPRAAKTTGRDAQTKLQRLGINRGGRYGGLLGQSAVFMATANGVDTQPVVRGVWVLENLLGMEPPAPPTNVPALTPVTQGSTTPRELLSAHTADPACASCHQRIDPMGFVLENYDPVGRWRRTWPGTESPIDAAVALPDGSRFSGPVEFKAWLVQNIDLFSECLAEKLMIYATGRVPNYSEGREIRAIVEENQAGKNGFRDLVLRLVESETFRTR